MAYFNILTNLTLTRNRKKNNT